jgi:hypothetical protein
MVVIFLICAVLIGLARANLPYIELNMTKAERSQAIYDRHLQEFGMNAAKAAWCQHDTIYGMDGEEFWMDNLWQRMGVRKLSQADYEKHVFTNKAGDKPWLLFFGRTPYGGPDGDFHSTLILFKRVVCVKEAFGDALNVGLIDTYQEEMIREAYDPDISRVGPSAPFIVLIKDGTAHMMP